MDILAHIEALYIVIVIVILSRCSGLAVRSCWGIWPVPLFLDADWGAGVGATLIHENKILPFGNLT